MKAYRLMYPGFFFYFLFLIVGAFLLILFPRGEIAIAINGRHSVFNDFIFKYGTHLGDGIAFAVLAFIYIFINYYRSLAFAIAFVIQTIIVQGLKLYVFPDVVRPKLYLENFNDLNIISGVEVHSFNAFPSGHTATAFTIGVLLSLFVKNRSWSMLFMFIAIFAAISRVYLLQHFFIDIYFGSIIGFLCGYFIFMGMEKTRLRDNPSWQRGLFWRQNAGK